MAITVTPVLGNVSVKKGGVLKDNARPAANNTRWMFDIEGELGKEEISIQLIAPRGKKPVSPDLLSCSFLPLDPSFYDAKPFLAEQVGGNIDICHAGGAGVCRYRVMIDVLHTATR